MLSVFIVDDETPARHRLRRHLEPLVASGRVTISGEAANGAEGLAAMSDLNVDLLLVDIQMPGMSGFDMVDQIPPDAMPNVVFVTAFDQYAVRAFEANAIDYVLKPVTQSRLLQSVLRAEDHTQRQRSADRLGNLMEWLDSQALTTNASKKEPRQEDYLQQISVPGRERTLIVSTEHLMAAEVNEGLTRLTVLDEKQPERTHHYVVSFTLEQLEKRLDPGRFIRIHRSAIVSVPHIRELLTWFSGRLKVRLVGGHEVIASRARSRELKNRLAL